MFELRTQNAIYSFPSARTLCVGGSGVHSLERRGWGGISTVLSILDVINSQVQETKSKQLVQDKLNKITHGNNN